MGVEYLRLGSQRIGPRLVKILWDKLDYSSHLHTKKISKLTSRPRGEIKRIFELLVVPHCREQRVGILSQRDQD